MAVDLTQQRAVSPRPTPTAHRRVEVVDADANAMTNAGHAKAYAASRVPDDDDTCRIDGRRRCSCRCRCWPCAASMDAADQDGTMTTLTINMRAAVFHLATLGFPRRPVFLPSTSPPEATRSALVAGSVKGGAGVRLPGFPVFRAPGYAPPSGGREREREIMCLLETKGSSCKRASPCQPAATEPVDVLGPMRIGGL